ncbi:hypothetical protein ACS0TY_018281 [Phlomoides rotata]
MSTGKESSDNSCLGVKRARKAKPGGGIRRSWIELEEIILMEALKELTALCVIGYGFNLSTKVFDVSDSAWAIVMKNDPSILGMSYKLWPFMKIGSKSLGWIVPTALLPRM